MTVRSVKDLADADRDGYTFFSGWRKQPTQTTAAGIWFDLSLSPGNPNPNYFIGSPGVFTPLKYSTDGGIPHGQNCSPRTKFLRVFEIQSASAAVLPVKLMDYIGFYPFIDESVTEEQFLVNSVPLPRYADGKGVMMMPVVVAGHIGGQTFFVRYTNQDGVPDRQTPQHVMGTQIVNGTIITSAGAVANSCAPFMALQAGAPDAPDAVAPQIYFRRLIRAHFETLLGPGNDFVPVMLYEHRSLSPRQRTVLAKLQLDYEAAWVPVLEALHANGQLKAPVKLARLLILGALNWSVQWFDEKKSASLDDLTDAALSLFLKES